MIQEQLKCAMKHVLSQNFYASNINGANALVT